MKMGVIEINRRTNKVISEKNGKNKRSKEGLKRLMTYGFV
jgi:hypothetical protein